MYVECRCSRGWQRLFFFQVVITTYQTLNSDFVIPSDIESDEEKEWLIDNGFADSILSICQPT